MIDESWGSICGNISCLASGALGWDCVTLNSALSILVGSNLHHTNSKFTVAPSDGSTMPRTSFELPRTSLKPTIWTVSTALSLDSCSAAFGGERSQRNRRGTSARPVRKSKIRRNFWGNSGSSLRVPTLEISRVRRGRTSSEEKRRTPVTTWSPLIESDVLIPGVGWLVIICLLCCSSIDDQTDWLLR